MKKLIKEIEVDQYDIDYLQFTKFEVNSYTKIIRDILIVKNPKYTYSKENYDHFMQEYKDAVYKNELTLRTLLDKYAPEYNKNQYEFNFQFDKNLLEIYEHDNAGEGGCNCENCEK